MKEKVLEILKAVNENIEDGINLVEEKLLDSLMIVDIAMELEDAFGIEIKLEDIYGENFETVDTIVALVEKSME